MTMTAERLAELDAVMAKVRAFSFGSEEWEVAFIPARLAAYNAYPDLRAHIDAQAATIAGLVEALREIVASDSPLGRNGVPSHKEIARRALKGIDHE